MPSLVRTAGSFAIVLVAYWTYALVAVPLIEPSADLQRNRVISDQDREDVDQLNMARLQQLVGLFPADAWELKDPKILQSDRVKLLLQEYRNLGDGRVELHPCTLILMPDAADDDLARQNRQAVILEAPEGALLEFDEPFDLRSFKIGRLVGGELIGPITIRSQGKRAGPEDDLLIKTRDVQLTEHHVWTPHPVDFRLGPNYGRGSQMHIEMLGAKEAGHRPRHGPNIARIASFEVRHVERLHLELGKTETLAAKPPMAPASDLPVEVTCRGPFRFDMIRKVATFEDRVDVLRLHPQGPSDQLTCELLSIFFTDRAKVTPNSPDDRKDGAKKKRSGSLDLQAQRIEARGDPVVLSAPSEQAHARGQRLEYDLQTNRIVLDGTHQVMLRQGPNEIHAPSLQYQSLGPGRLGRIVAEGPGWLRGQMAERPDEQLEAQWSDQLTVRPHEQNQVISLSGGAGLKFRGIGQLKAGEIHFWLWQSPPEADSDKLRLRPDRMLARDNVQVDSPQFSATNVEQLEVWFEHGANAESGKQKTETPTSARRHGNQALAGRATTPFSGRRHGDLRTTDYRLPTADHQPHGPQSVGVVGKMPFRLPPTAYRRPSTAYRLPSTGRRRQHFEITGRLLQARVLLREDERPELSELMVEDRVHFVETHTAQPGEQPLRLRGDRLHAVNADKPHAAVTVSGTPAHFEGRGLSLTGPNINLNRGTNRLWIDGPGEMDLPLERDLEGRRLRNPGRLEVRWQKGMEFDGRTAQFEEKVTATGPQLHVQTETLEVQLKRVIRFSDPEPPEDAQAEQLVERLRCHGGVLMENRDFEGPTQTSHERMQVVDLTIHFGSGALSAAGPGWFRSVRYGSGDLLAAPNSTRVAVGDASHSVAVGDASHSVAVGDASHSAKQLRCLEVRFQGRITGNVEQRTMTFHDQVHAAYGPADSWQSTLDMDNPEALGPGGAILHCDRLSVNQMPAPTGNRGTLELEAAGNVVVEGNEEGNTYIARATRLTYAQAKDLLVLEGDGRSDARLYRQKQLGGRRDEVAARKILYWRKTKRLRVEGARSGELSGLPTADPGKQ